MRYDKALQVLAPGAEWEMIGTEILWKEQKDGSYTPDPSTFIWKSDMPMPSRDDLIEEAIKQHNILTYVRNRSIAYPPITDYIDGVVKGDQEQIQAYIDACQAVKAKYPKPE